MEESIAEKMSRIIKEKDMNIKSNRVKHLRIFDLKEGEYDRFITFLKSDVPTNQGNDGIMLLLDVFERYKMADKLISKLEDEIIELKKQLADTADEEDKPKKKWIGSE
ncbi:MAG: hypothetical protein PHX50_16370 [Massilibacteroides sp.]|nr:hypothetical protein [Clostridia bacterium]MDD3064372.1 hypothetical protein [Massilibacteroides sp.]